MEGLGDGSQREYREFGLGMENKLGQGRKMKEIVGALAQEKGKCCRGSKTEMCMVEKQCW